MVRRVPFFCFLSFFVENVSFLPETAAERKLKPKVFFAPFGKSRRIENGDIWWIENGDGLNRLNV